MNLDHNDLRARDRRHLWHPYSDINAIETENFPIIVEAEGVYLITSEGKRVLDGISSWWCCNLGHGHPRLLAALRQQADKLQHSMLGGMSHPSAIILAERLSSVAPPGLNRVLFAGDGSSAVEAALKGALQYWTNQGATGRNQFIALADAYHGDTFGAMGVGFVPRFHQCFAPALRRALVADSPHCFHCPAGMKRCDCDIECFASMRALVCERHKTIAAVIVEPLCQAAAGMRVYPADYLRRLRRLCDEYGLLLIADEIAVGFGRTGTMFACEQADISPDILCLGKGLAGGYLPLSATLFSERVYDSFRGEGRAFHHGHTYCGNPLGAAVALATLDAFAEDKVLENARQAMKQLEESFSALKSHAAVARTSTLGMIGVIEIAAEYGPLAAKSICAGAWDLGLSLRPLGNIIYLWPPLTTTPEEMRRMLDIISKALDAAPPA